MRLAELPPWPRAFAPSSACGRGAASTRERKGTHAGRDACARGLLVAIATRAALRIRYHSAFAESLTVAVRRLLGVVRIDHSGLGARQQESMRVLVSNDDGVDAPGLRVLAARLADVGEVTVVAPDRDRSGASNSLTLDQPIRVVRLDDGRYRVAGTPTDCVHLALSGLLDHEPDIVVSGINNSGNLGDDVIYSVTVSAAMEGRFLGFPAIAISLDGPGEHHDGKGHHFDSAARAVSLLMRRLVVDPLPADTILNVNVPDRVWNEI